MSKIKGLDEAVQQEPILASAWVEPSNAVGMRVFGVVSPAVAAALNSAGNSALVATEQALWVVPLKMGLMSQSAAGPGARLSRGDLTGITLGSGVANVPISVQTTDGNELTFLVHKSRRKAVEQVKAALNL